MVSQPRTSATFLQHVARVAKPLVIQSIEMTPWVQYGHDGETQEVGFQVPSNIRSIHRHLCELSELVHRTLYVLYTPGDNLTIRDVLDLYTCYLEWYDTLPGLLRLSANSIPCMLFLQYVIFSLPIIKTPS